MGIDIGASIVVRGAAGPPIGAELRQREQRVHLRYRSMNFDASGHPDAPSIEDLQRVLIDRSSQSVTTRNILRDFLGIHGGQSETIRSFVSRYGYLGLDDNEWPAGWAQHQQLKGVEGKDGTITEITGEPCSAYYRYAALAWAVVRGAEYLREHTTLSTQARRAIAKDLAPLEAHWGRFLGRWVAKERDLVYVDGIPESVGEAGIDRWRAIAFGKDSPRTTNAMDLTMEKLLTSGMTELRSHLQVTEILVPFVNWWMEAGRCYPVLAMTKDKPTKLRIAYTGGPWAAIGYGLLQIVGGIGSSAACDQCGRFISRSRAPKRGQATLCSEACRRSRNTILKAESRKRTSIPR